MDTYIIEIYLKSGGNVITSGLSLDTVSRFDKWYSGFKLFPKPFSLSVFDKNDKFNKRLIIDKGNISFYRVLHE